MCYNKQVNYRENIMRDLSLDLKDKIGQSVEVKGWVNSRRDHGGLIFIDLRDEKGIIQLVVTPDTKDSFALAESVRDEYVLAATGKIRERAPELKNPNIETGDIELVVRRAHNREDAERIERDRLEKETEENRIQDLKERCLRKGLDFEKENERYLQKAAKKRNNKKKREE